MNEVLERCKAAMEKVRADLAADPPAEMWRAMALMTTAKALVDAEQRIAELEAENAALKADARLGAMVRNGVRTQHRLNLKYDPWQEAYHVTVDLAELNVRGDHRFRHRVNADLDEALAAALGEETGGVA